MSPVCLRWHLAPCLVLIPHGPERGWPDKRAGPLIYPCTHDQGVVPVSQVLHGNCPRPVLLGAAERALGQGGQGGGR